MSETPKTLLFVGAAVLAVLLAYFASPKAIQPELFSDEGEPFFTSFTSPDQAESLEVTEFNVESGTPKAFSVRLKDGRWVIPSHLDYPADAKDRMAKAAGLLIGLSKGSVRSDRAADHAALGVLDPDTIETAGQLDGVGTKVTFKDKSGGVLASLILGKKDGEGDERFVRVPGKNRVYRVKLAGEVNAEFKDWIETDLLKMDAYMLSRLVLDNYSVESDGYRARLLPGERIELAKEAGTWKLPGLSETEETNTTKISEVTRELDEIKIVDVYGKPEGLNERLEAAEGRSLEALMTHLVQRGYYYDPRNNRIVSNQGDLIAVNDKGVKYTLRFGDEIFGTSDVIRAGSGEEHKTDEGKESGQAKKANRFLMVSVELDESVFTKPTEAALPADIREKRKKARDDINALIAAVTTFKSRAEGKLPESLAALTEGENPPLKEVMKDPWGKDYTLEAKEGDSFVIRSEGEPTAGPVASDDFAKEDKIATLARDWEAYEKKLADGKSAVESLSKRFGPWYYIIDAESFKKLRVARADLVQPKTLGPPPGDNEDR
jgi:hypothetical protein